jgi:hypothetical protein
MKRLIFFVPLLFGALYGENLIPYRKGDKWGFSTEDKKIVIRPKYNKVWPFGEDETATKVMLKGKYGMIDRRGKEVVRPIYDEIEWFSESLLLVKFNNKYGLLNANNFKEVVKPIYDEIKRSPFSESFLMVKLSDKYGLLRADNFKEVVKPVYDEIKRFSGSFLMVKLNDKYGLLRADNFKEVVKPKYSNIEKIWGYSYFKVYAGDKVGLIDTTGNEVIPVKYEDINIVSGEKTLVEFKENGKRGIMDLSGKVILQANYEVVYYNKGKEIFAVLDNKPYVFDTSGKEIQYEFKKKYENQYEFEGREFSIVSYEFEGGEISIVSRAGKVIQYQFKEKYENQYESEGKEEKEYSEDYGDFSIVSRAGKKGLVSKDGKVIIPIAYDEIRYDERNEIFFIAKKEYKDKWRLEYKYKWGLANKKGKIFVSMKYDYLTTFCKGLIVVKSNDKFGLMDKTGKIIVYPKYDMLGLVEESNDEGYRIIRISEGQSSFYNAFFAENRSLSEWSDDQIKYVEEYCRDLFLVGKEGYKFGLIDENGTEVLRTEFDEVAPYEDLILARKGDKWGIFDLRGKTILEMKYDWISFEDLKEGREFLRIKENYEAGLVDRKGNTVIPPKYDDIRMVVGDKVVVQVGAYIGIVDINGREILPAEYEDFRIFNENLFLMSKDLKWGLFDTEKGKFVLPVKYDEINYDENMGLFFVERDGKEFYVKVFSDGKVIEYFDP